MNGAEATKRVTGLVGNIGGMTRPRERYQCESFGLQAKRIWDQVLTYILPQRRWEQGLIRLERTRRNGTELPGERPSHSRTIGYKLRSDSNNREQMAVTGNKRPLQGTNAFTAALGDGAMSH